MALVDIPRDHVVGSSIARLCRAVARRMADRHAKRQQKAVLQDLLFAPEHRLRDLGISRADLIRAIEHRH